MKIKFLENEQELYEVARLHTDSIKNTYVGISEQEWLDSLNYEDSYKFWKRQWLRSDNEVILMKEGDEVVGFAMIIFFSVRAGIGLLDRLHVRKDMQHRGIGKRLIAASAGFLWNMGFDSLEVGVIEGNVRAEMVYKALGAELMRTYMLNGLLRKRYIWNNLEELADKSVYKRLEYDYEQLYPVLECEFMLFGAGEYCDAFMDTFPDAVPKKIFDNDPQKWGMLKGGIVVEEPSKADNIIIATGYYSEIEKQMKELGCQNIVHYYPWHRYGQRGKQ